MTTMGALERRVMLLLVMLNSKMENVSKKESNGKNIPNGEIIQEKVVRDLKLAICASHIFKGKASDVSRKVLKNMVDKLKLNSVDKDIEA